METTTLCTVIAALTVLPNRSQFFQYESIALSCEQQGNSSEWRIKRNTSINTNEECPTPWNIRNSFYCSITDLYPSDSGVYWCESGTGCYSNTISITVTAGSVILESPALPVTEGKAVTLRCINDKTSSFNLTTDFYKDGVLIGSSSTGDLTIHSVSKSDEGFHKCNISGAGQSPDVWLSVRVGLRDTAKNFRLTYILLPVVGVCLSLVLVLPLWLWRSHKAKMDPDISYTDVTITQDAQPQRIRAADAVDDVPTLYSTIKLETT